MVLVNSGDKESKTRRDNASIFCVTCKIGEDEGAIRDAVDGIDSVAKAL